MLNALQWICSTDLVHQIVHRLLVAYNSWRDCMSSEGFSLSTFLWWWWWWIQISCEWQAVPPLGGRFLDASFISNSWCFLFIASNGRLLIHPNLQIVLARGWSYIQASGRRLLYQNRVKWYGKHWVTICCASFRSPCHCMRRFPRTYAARDLVTHWQSWIARGVLNCGHHIQPWDMMQ